ncbi:MAG TPA: hypothetical protein VMT75_03160 [Candidatus Saccharimonadales bacterium]|nr:hypothetical protein [Candidatus Saccharimonadales bacterium]
MGNEALCTLRYGGKTFAGKALLETTEIVFRGETRLKIPFSSIKNASAKDGELHIPTAEGLAVFQLGPQAEKWRNKIANPKSLVEKLGVKPGESVLLEGEFPADFAASLKKHGATVARQGSASSTPWIFLAAESAQDVRRVAGIAKSMRGATALWIVYPKGQKTVTEADVRSAGLKSGLTDIKVASFSPTHTALKFVIPKSRR